MRLFSMCTVALACAALSFSGCNNAVDTEPQPANSKQALEMLNDPALAKVFDGSAAFVKRILPNHAGQFAIEIIPAVDGKDVFALGATPNGKVLLKGNNQVAVASALNHYLKYTAQCNISWNCGNQLNLPEKLPLPKETRIVSPHKYRPAYNYCTHGYTMPWWDFDRWETELDYLAMNGLNMALIIQGQEQIWINTLTQFGYTEAEVLEWLVMPSHQPWMYMANMERFGGPMPAALPAKRAELVRKIIARMNELGMKPILQGYYGMVPRGFGKKFPAAKIHGQGNWANNLPRPDMLSPEDPLFAKIADVFYAEQRKLYGTLEYLAADPFHEGGSTAGIDLPKCGKTILGLMHKAQPDAVWVIQAWHTNPRKELLSALDKSKVLVLDLFCESRTVWKNRKGFEGTPWVWCTISNFGGNNGLDGVFKGLAEQPAKALTDPDRGPYSGVGAVPEGSQTNPALWDMFFENIWRDQPVADCNAWLHDYAQRRYGAKSPLAENAWNFLLRASYSRPWRAGSGGETPFNSVMNARPSLDPNQRARTWAGSPVPPYENRAGHLYAAWESLIAAEKECAQSDGYRFDVADVTRQMICDAATRIHGHYVKAYKAKDIKKVEELSALMLSLFDDMEELLATRKEWLLGVWIADARRWGTTKAESDLYEYNARVLLTTWTDPTANLTDYANRSWAGLVGTFYKVRWEKFYATANAVLKADKSLDVGKLRNEIRDWEYTWNQSTTPFPVEPKGDTLTVAKRILEKFNAMDPAITQRGVKPTE